LLACARCADSGLKTVFDGGRRRWRYKGVWRRRYRARGRRPPLFTFGPTPQQADRQGPSVRGFKAKNSPIPKANTLVHLRPMQVCFRPAVWRGGGAKAKTPTDPKRKRSWETINPRPAQWDYRVIGKKRWSFGTAPRGRNIKPIDYVVTSGTQTGKTISRVQPEGVVGLTDFDRGHQKRPGSWGRFLC